MSDAFTARLRQLHAGRSAPLKVGPGQRPPGPPVDMLGGDYERMLPK